MKCNRCTSGKTIRYSDGRKIRCPICLGSGKRPRPGPTDFEEITPYGYREAHPPYCTCVQCVATRISRRPNPKFRFLQWVKSLFKRGAW